jgi:hypothetical protein
MARIPVIVHPNDGDNDNSLTPTRAEVNDSNSVMDGADAVMLQEKLLQGTIQ